MRLVLLLTLLFAPVIHAQGWREPDADNLVYLELEAGTVVIELAPFMAPMAVSQFKALVREGFYDGLDFYRVIDGFVAQGGDYSESRASAHSEPLPLEAERTYAPDDAFLLIQEPDLLSAQTGVVHGFPAGRDPGDNSEWLLHCYGTVALARSTEPDTGSTEFYIVIGQAPRHLDRNMSVFGRVLLGMELVQGLPRGTRDNNGVIEAEGERGKILRAVVASDLPEAERLPVEVQQETGTDYAERLESARSLSNAFYIHKGSGNLDACYVRTTARLKPAQE